jgi:hypothetical protein
MPLIEDDDVMSGEVDPTLDMVREEQDVTMQTGQLAALL